MPLLSILTVTPLRPTALLLNIRNPDAEFTVVGANVIKSITLSLGFSENGKVAPDTVNPVPLIVGGPIVIGASPVEVSITGRVAFDPTITSPKFNVTGLIFSSGLVRATPMVIRLMAIPLRLKASLLIMSVPTDGLGILGAAVTFRFKASPGFSVRGKVAPDTVYSSPLIADEVIVNGAVPAEITVTGSVIVDPTATLPKLRLVVLILSCAFVRATPVLLRKIVILGVLGELLIRVRVPIATPVLKAAACTSIVTLCRGLRISGKLAPDTLNPTPIVVAEMMTTGDIPIAVTVTGNVVVDPRGTSPNRRVVGLTDRSSLPGAGAYPDLVLNCPEGTASFSIAPSEGRRSLIAGLFAA